MTMPFYCEFTGKLIESVKGDHTKPVQDYDYYIVANKILSREGKKKFDEIVDATMAKRGFGAYDFNVYKKVVAEVAKQYCTKLRTYPKAI